MRLSGISIDQKLRVVAASRSFYLMFKVSADDTQGKLLYDLGDGQWDIPKLRLLLGKIVPDQGAMENYEVEYDFPSIGRRTMLLNARKVFYEKGSHSTILLGIEDITDKRILENEKDDLIRQKQVLLEELEHRVANSLQIIASIIMLKARAVELEETRRHLQDAHNRVISVAAVQKHLHGSVTKGSIEMGPYLATLAKSMISDNRAISIKFSGTGGISTSRKRREHRLNCHRARYQFPQARIRRNNKGRRDHGFLRRIRHRLAACGLRQWLR
jgi:hypothetical protein